MTVTEQSNQSSFWSFEYLDTAPFRLRQIDLAPGIESLRVIAHGRKLDTPGLRQKLERLYRDRFSTANDVEVDLDARVTEAPHQAWGLAAEAADRGVDRILAIGGDGLVNEVVNGIVEGAPSRDERPELAVVPVGTANDFAYAADLPPELGAALALALAGPARAVDLGRVNERYFLNVASGGPLSDAAASMHPNLKGLLGEVSYITAALLKLPQSEAMSLRLRSEDWSWEGRAHALIVGNGIRGGGGFELCPGALVNDGRLDLSVVPAELDFSAMIPLVTDRSLENIDGVIYRPFTELELEADADFTLNLDGEPTVLRRAHVEVLPRAIDLCLPHGSSVLQGPRLVA